MNFEKKPQMQNESKREPLISVIELSDEAKKKIKNFEQGDITLLEDPDIIEIIPQHIFNLYHKGDMILALILLESLGEWSRNDNIRYRERSLMVLSLITEKVLEEDHEDFLEAMSRILIKWLRYETEYLAGFEFICLQLQKMVRKMLQQGLWYQSEDLIVILYKIKRGIIKKSKAFTQVIARVHSGLAEKPFLEKLTHTYINEQDDRHDIAATLLVNFGDKSAYHLLYTLCSCQDKDQRLNLIEILPATGPETIPALINLLQKEPPWYIVRNIILILSKLADPSLFYLVQPFMTHKDIRVQQEVIDCVKRMSDSKMVDRLFEALKVCNNKLKPQIIRYLGHQDDERIGTALTDLLRNLPSCDQLILDDIIQEICGSLKSFPSEEAVESLQSFLIENSKRDDMSPGVISYVEKTFLSLQQEVQLPELPEENGAAEEPLIVIPQKSRPSPPVVEEGPDKPTVNLEDPLSIDFTESEDLAPALDDLSSVPTETSPDTAKYTADQEDTLTIDWQESQDIPPALDEVSDAPYKTPLDLFSPIEPRPERLATKKTGEEDLPVPDIAEGWLKQSIENDNIPSFLRQHLLLRINFYQQFSEDEFTAFLSLLSPRIYKQGETLVSSGDFQSNLFFIDSGRVDLVFPGESSETYVRELQRGDVFGNDIFMSGSEWDISLVALDDTEVYVFDQEQLLNMQSRYPDLTLKVLEYCKQHDVVLSLLQMINESVPQQDSDEQIALTGNTGEHIADIELVNISTAGFCYSLNLPKGFGHSVFADKKLTAYFTAEPDRKETIDGDIIALQFIESENRKLYICSKFQQKKDLSGFTCTRVGLL